MKYIPGQAFTVGKPKPKQGGSVLQRAMITRPVETANFKIGNQYVIQTIKPVNNTEVQYCFLNQTTGSTFTHTFSAFSEADKMLDKYMG